MSYSSVFPSLQAGIGSAAGWPSSGVRREPGTADAAARFGFHAEAGAARVLSAPPSSGESVAQMQARFVACLFEPS